MTQAEKTIRRYIKNFNKLNKGIGKDSPFVGGALHGLKASLRAIKEDKQ